MVVVVAGYVTRLAKPRPRPHGVDEIIFDFPRNRDSGRTVTDVYATQRHAELYALDAGQEVFPLRWIM